MVDGCRAGPSGQEVVGARFGRRFRGALWVSHVAPHQRVPVVHAVGMLGTFGWLEKAPVSKELVVVVVWRVSVHWDERSRALRGCRACRGSGQLKVEAPPLHQQLAPVF